MSTILLYIWSSCYIPGSIIEDLSASASTPNSNGIHGSDSGISGISNQSNGRMARPSPSASTMVLTLLEEPMGLHESKVCVL